jgi:hypothetical protein
MKNLKLDASFFAYSLLALYTIWLMANGTQIDFPKTILGLGLVGFAMYQQYLERLRILNSLTKEYEDHKNQVNQELQYMKSKMAEVDEMKKILMSTKTVGQINPQSQARF